MPPEENVSRQRIRILIVDDEPAILVLLARILERAGHEVLTAATGAAALDTLATHDEEVALLLVDVKLPDMSGRELVQGAAARFGHRPVLFVSGVDQRSETDDLQPGDAFLAKPFDAADLTSRVRMLLRDRSGSPRLE